MYRYILKRLLFLIPTVLGVTLIIFAVMNITPGNPGRMILGANANAAEVEAVNQELGFYDPVLVRWARYLENVFTKGDFGQSYSTKLDVFDELWPRFMITLRLAVLVLVLSVSIGVPLGILSAVKQNSLMDTIPTMIAFFLAAVPSFVVGIVLMRPRFANCLRICASQSPLCWSLFVRTMFVLPALKALQNVRLFGSTH